MLSSDFPKDMRRGNECQGISLYQYREGRKSCPVFSRLCDVAKTEQAMDSRVIVGTGIISMMRTECERWSPSARRQPTAPHLADSQPQKKHHPIKGHTDLRNQQWPNESIAKRGVNGSMLHAKCNQRLTKLHRHYADPCNYGLCSHSH